MVMWTTWCIWGSLEHRVTQEYVKKPVSLRTLSMSTFLESQLATSVLRLLQETKWKRNISLEPMDAGAHRRNRKGVISKRSEANGCPEGDQERGTACLPRVGLLEKLKLQLQNFQWQTQLGSTTTTWQQFSPCDDK